MYVEFFTALKSHNREFCSKNTAQFGSVDCTELNLDVTRNGGNSRDVSIKLELERFA